MDPAQLQDLLHGLGAEIRDGLATGFANMPQPQQPQPKAKLWRFTETGGDAWLEFRSHFEAVALANGWTDSQARLQLAAAVQGSAQTMIGSIPTEAFVHRPDGRDAHPVKLLLDQYENRFLPEAGTGRAHDDFNSAHQLEEESIIKWHARVRRLFRRAHPRLSMNDIPEMGKHTIRRIFVEGLYNAEVRQKVKDSDPPDFDEGLRRALWFESQLPRKPRDRATSGTVAYMSGGNGESSRQDHEESVCNACGRKGHWKRDCRLWAQVGEFLKNITQNQRSNGGGRVQRSSPRGSGSRRGSNSNRGRGGPRGRGGNRGGGRSRDRRGVNQVDDADADDEEGDQEGADDPGYDDQDLGPEDDHQEAENL